MLEWLDNFAEFTLLVFACLWAATVCGELARAACDLYKLIRQ